MNSNIYIYAVGISKTKLYNMSNILTNILNNCSVYGHHHEVQHQVPVPLDAIHLVATCLQAALSPATPLHGILGATCFRKSLSGLSGAWTSLSSVAHAYNQWLGPT